jgi:membrane protease subunit HflK
LFNRLI